jgi:SAM-dependent methyltransferase
MVERTEETRRMEPGIAQFRRHLSPGEVREFYESDVVIDTFNEGFAGAWHTRVVPDLPGPKNSITYVCSLLGVEASHRVLDFGCGVGVPTLSIARLAGCQVRGLNISHKQVAMARRLAAESGMDRQVAFDLYDGRRFPYGEDEFDREFFFESPCHVPNKELLASELYRVLRPGGSCVGQDWALTSTRISAADHRDYIQPIEVSCCVSLLSMAEYGELFEQAGFASVHVIDARGVYAGLAASFTRPSDRPVVADAADGIVERLQKGNLALSNAFHKGLFTIGFVCAEKARSMRGPT